MAEHPDRVHQLTALVDGQPIADDDQPGTSGRLRRLCVTVTEVLPATWAGLSLAEDGKVSGALTGSDAHARELEGLQFTFGEGPCVDSVRTRRPVMEPDIAIVSSEQVGEGFHSRFSAQDRFYRYRIQTAPRDPMRSRAIWMANARNGSSGKRAAHRSKIGKLSASPVSARTSMAAAHTLAFCSLPISSANNRLASLAGSARAISHASSRTSASTSFSNPGRS